MSLNYLNLIDPVRAFMVEEIEADAGSDKTYFSNYLSEKGRRDWVDLLKTAARLHDDGWFAAQLQSNGRLLTRTERRKPSGGYTMAKVPVTAHETLAEGEFNRFYIRGLCRYAIEGDVQEIVVYRAKERNNPRRESEDKIDARFDPMAVLNDLRENVGVETSTGFPAPNTGLSARLP